MLNTKLRFCCCFELLLLTTTGRSAVEQTLPSRIICFSLLRSMLYGWALAHGVSSWSLVFQYALQVCFRFIFVSDSSLVDRMFMFTAVCWCMSKSDLLCATLWDYVAVESSLYHHAWSHLWASKALRMIRWSAFWGSSHHVGTFRLGRFNTARLWDHVLVVRSSYFHPYSNATASNTFRILGWIAIRNNNHHVSTCWFRRIC